MASDEDDDDVAPRRPLPNFQWTDGQDFEPNVYVFDGVGAGVQASATAVVDASSSPMEFFLLYVNSDVVCHVV